MSSAMARLAAERAARAGHVLPTSGGWPKPSPQGSRSAPYPKERKAHDAAALKTALCAVTAGLDGMVKSLDPASTRAVMSSLRGMIERILDSPDQAEFRVIRKRALLARLKGCRRPEEFLLKMGFVTRRGDDGGKQIDWYVLDHARETASAPRPSETLLAAIPRGVRGRFTRRPRRRRDSSPRRRRASNRGGRGAAATRLRVGVERRVPRRYPRTSRSSNAPRSRSRPRSPRRSAPPSRRRRSATARRRRSSSRSPRTGRRPSAAAGAERRRVPAARPRHRGFPRRRPESRLVVFKKKSPIVN